MRKILSKTIPVIVIILAFIVLIICASHIFPTISEYKEADNEYETLKGTYVTDDKFESTDDAGYPNLDINVSELLKINEDYTAWFYFEDLDISLPIVKEKKSEINKYIMTTFEGTTNASGCLFIPYDAGSNFTNMNTFVYGHNMTNRSMFGSLKTLYNNPKSVTDPYFYIYPRSGSTKKYRVIAVVKTNAQSDLYHIPKVGADYTQHLSKALSAGRFDSYVPFTESEEKAMEDQSELVTLSTCYGRSGSGQRLLVIGIKVN